MPRPGDTGVFYVCPEDGGTLVYRQEGCWWCHTCGATYSSLSQTRRR
jgi:predicted RNA-binding Zn-ribbon protein involved in translation (DUF1610 family)